MRLPPAQLARILEVLRQAEHLVARLAKESLRGRGVVRLPADGYPLSEIERDAIVQALALTGGVQKHAAALLGISPRVMHYKVHQLGLRHRKDGR